LKFINQYKYRSSIICKHSLTIRRRWHIIIIKKFLFSSNVYINLNYFTTRSLMKIRNRAISRYPISIANFGSCTYILGSWSTWSSCDGSIRIFIRSFTCTNIDVILTIISIYCLFELISSIFIEEFKSFFLLILFNLFLLLFLFIYS
jgi:hypothetical protein